MMQEILELDNAIRQALNNQDGEAALRLAQQHDDLLHRVMDMEDKTMRETLARQLSELLARNIELAITVRERVREELRTVMQQRKLAGSATDNMPVRSFHA